VGGYDEAMPVQGWEDWDYWLRVAQAAPSSFRYIPRILFFYRIHAASMQARTHHSSNISSLMRYMADKHAEFFRPRFPQIWSDLIGESVQLRAMSAASHRELMAAKSVLAARDEELTSVKFVLAAREEELASVKFVLAAREEELASVKFVLAAREEELASV